MEFPEFIKVKILSYLPYPYKKPLHLDVIKMSKEYRIQSYKKPPHLDIIKKSDLFIDFKFNKSYFLEFENDISTSIHNTWFDSVIEFIKFIKKIREGPYKITLIRNNNDLKFKSILNKL